MRTTSGSSDERPHATPDDARPGRTRLVLFDIDGTLLATAGMGIRAMERAGRKLFTESFDASLVDYAGSLDPVIMRELLVLHEIDPTPEHMATFRAAYAQCLAELLAPDGTSRALPGVPELIDALAKESSVVIGVLTGNFGDTGTLKITRAGLSMDAFRVRVWGDDSPHDPPLRDHLPPVGMRRCAEIGRGVAGADVVIIGDTPRDVACARAHQCRAIGVATGRFGTGELQASGAHLTLDTLADSAEITRWILTD